MYIVWKAKGGTDTCELVESRRINGGQPRQCFVEYLGSIPRVGATDEQREAFWRGVRAGLGKHNETRWTDKIAARHPLPDGSASTAKSVVGKAKPTMGQLMMERHFRLP